MVLQPDAGKNRRAAGPLGVVPPSARLLFAVVLVCFVVAMPGFWAPGFAGVTILLAVLTAVSRVPLKTIFGRMLLAEPFAVAIALMALFQPAGVRLFLLMLAKSTLCLFCMVLLGATTSFPEILNAFKKLRVPGLLITTMALTYRYLFVLVEEADRMKRARLSRSFRRGRLHTWHLLASIISELFMRAAGRAERIYMAMCSRGWRT